MKKLLATVGIMIFLFGAATGAFAAKKDVVKIGYLRNCNKKLARRDEFFGVSGKFNYLQFIAVGSGFSASAQRRSNSCR